MKKIVSLLLCLAVLGTMTGYAADTVGGELVYNEAELFKAVYILNDLGITELQEETEIWKNKSVSRGEFAEMICKAFKLETTSTQVYFVDVPYDMWAFQPVVAMVERGYLSVPEDRRFRPDDAITYAEALKMVLGAAGYHIYAEYNGGFPYGYTRAATYLELGVTAGVDTEISVAAAVTLLYDVMSMGFYEPIHYTEDGPIQYQETEEIIFAILWDTYIERGCLEAYYGAGYGAVVYQKDEVIIDGTKYFLANEIYLNHYFLSEVEFIYQKVSDQEKNIVYMEECKDTGDVVISSEDIIGFRADSYTLSYYKNDSAMEKELQRGIPVVYNGAAYGGSISSVIDEFTQGGNQGTIRLKSTRGVVDTVVIKSYRNVVVGYADSGESKLYNKFDSSDCIDLTEYEQAVVKSLEGADTTIDYGTLPMLLAVAESKDKSVIEIVICREKLTAIVQEVSGEGTEMQFTIHDTKYKITDSLYQNQMLDGNGVAIPISTFMGGEYEFYLDSFGKIGYINAIGAGNGFKLGFIIDGVKSDSVFANNLILKLLTETEEVVEYSIKDKVVIDGVSYKLENINGILNALDQGAQISNATVEPGHLAQQTIRYQADEELRITEIDTAYVGAEENEDNTLTLIDGDGVEMFSYKPTGGMPKFGQTILFSTTETKVFAIPRTNASGKVVVSSDASGELSGNIIIKQTTSGYRTDTEVLDATGNAIRPTNDMYKMGLVGSLVGDASYAIRAYKYNPNTPYCDAMVYNYEPYSVPLENVMIEGFEQVLNSEGEPVNALVGWQRGVKVTYEIADNSDVSDLECGDIVYLWKDVSGKKVIFVTKIYDYSDDKFVNRPSADKYFVDHIWSANWNQLDGNGNPQGYYYRYNELAKGLVLEKIGNTMRWDWDGNYRNFEQTFDFANIPIVIYDKEAVRKQVYVGSVAEVPDFKSVGEANAARIVINTDCLRGVCAFVYLNY